jgi:AP2 domain/HNH endonuclease
MKEIQTIDGFTVLVDDEDYGYISECYDLHIDKLGYVQCRIKNKFKYKNMGLWSSLSLHKLLMNPEKTGRRITVDHIDGNKLNNQKSNLRICTHQENMWNRKPQSVYANEEVYSEYKGVTWCKSNKKWMVQLRGYEVGKRGYVGTFTNEIAAANAYNYYALQIFGEFAQLNVVEYMPKEEWEKYRLSSKKTSKYRGVSYNSSTEKYIAQIWDTRRNIRIGEFDTEEEAALAYNEMAVKLRGDKAKLNKINK